MSKADKEKTVEEMITVLKTRFSEKAQAEALCNAGYGNVTHAIKEFTEKVEEICDRYHLNTKEIVMTVINMAKEDLYGNGNI